MRSAVVFLGVAIGESVPRFDIVMALIGGTLTGPLVFVLPPLIYARAKALKIEMASRPPNLEIISPTQRYSGSEALTDPRIHSQSVFYGFIDDNVNRNRYSYVYYDDDSPDGLLSDPEDETTSEERAIVEDLRLRNLEKETARPRLVDSAEPEKILRIKSVKRLQFGTNSNEKRSFHRLIDWFGYFIVALGIIITISSTYINIKNTIRYVNFTPPCIINATISANVLGLA